MPQCECVCAPLLVVEVSFWLHNISLW